MFSCRRPCLLPFCSCCCAEIVYLHSACLLWLLRHFTIWEAPNSSVVDKRTKAQCSQKQNLSDWKAVFFSPFVKASLRADIIKAIFCGCALLWCCMSHSTAARAQLCAANILLKGLHGAGNKTPWFFRADLYIHNHCAGNAADHYNSPALQCNQRSVGLLSQASPDTLPLLCKILGLHLLWHPTGRRWNFEAWSEI